MGYSGQFIANWENNISSPPAARVPDRIRALKIDEDEIFQVLAEDSMTYWRHVISGKTRKKVVG